MSARHRRFGPGRAPRIDAVTPVSATARTSSSAERVQPVEDHALRALLLGRKLGVLVQVAAGGDRRVGQGLTAGRSVRERSCGHRVAAGGDGYTRVSSGITRAPGSQPCPSSTSAPSPRTASVTDARDRRCRRRRRGCCR